MEHSEDVKMKELQETLARLRNLEERWEKSYWGDNWKHVKANRDAAPDQYKELSLEAASYRLHMIETAFRLRMRYRPLQVKWIMDSPNFRIDEQE